MTDSVLTDKNLIQKYGLYDVCTTVQLYPEGYLNTIQIDTVKPIDKKNDTTTDKT